MCKRVPVGIFPTVEEQREDWSKQVDIKLLNV